MRLPCVSNVHCVAPLLIAGLCSSLPAQASLVGDQVLIGHYSPDASVPLPGATPPALRTVEAGNTDVYTFYNSYPFGYNVNVDASSIDVSFDYVIAVGETGTWPAGNYEVCTPIAIGVFDCSTRTIAFNGLRISSLDDSSHGALTQVAVDTNLQGWDASQLSFGVDTVQFDWKGLSFTRDSFLRANLTFAGSANVPEPTTAALSVGALFAAMLARRRASIR